MGFLQICSGVVLLQLSKSAKDVPDAAVFKGDLDQVRTVAEQPEPESEPKADTMRGTAALLRGISVSRKKREVEEAKRIHEERMEPIAENEHVEWDGIRRRKTVLEPGQTGLKRTKTMHPPLGMTHFPDEEEDRQRQSIDDESGPTRFFSSFRRRTMTVPRSPQARDTGSGAPPPSAFGAPAYPVLLTEISNNSKGAGVRPTPSSRSSDSATNSTHIYGLPPGLHRPSVPPHLQEDTSYKSPSLGSPASHLQWASSVADQDRTKSRGNDSSRLAPDPPAHAARRQFSFQNVFHRHRGHAEAERPTSRSTLSSLRKVTPTSGDATTEEERLGLVKGDSAKVLAQPDYGEAPQYDSDPEELGHDDWTMASGSVRTESPVRVASPQHFRSPPIREEREEDEYMSTPRQPQSQMPRSLPAFRFETGRRSDDDSTMTDDDDDVDDKLKYDRIWSRDDRSTGSGGGAFV